MAETAYRNHQPYTANTTTTTTTDTKDYYNIVPQRGPWAGAGGPTTQQIVALVTLLPVGGILLGLSGLTFVGTLIGLAVATPLFILFSPVIVPAALTLALAVLGFLASGAFGITALSSLYWLAKYVRQMRSSMMSANRLSAAGEMDYPKWRVQQDTKTTARANVS